MDKEEEATEMSVRESLQLQLQELELLSSMFPGELRLDDDAAPGVVQSFVDGATRYESVDSRLGFTVQIRSCHEDQVSARAVTLFKC